MKILTPLGAALLAASITACATPPTAPTPTATPVAQVTPPAPIRFDGAYTMTLTAAPECGQLPADVRTRTYAVTIEDLHAIGTPDQLFLVRLPGAAFAPERNVMWGWVDYRSGFAAHFTFQSLDAVNQELDNQSLIERPSPTTSLQLLGTAVAHSPLPNGRFLTAFQGSFSYCADAGDAMPDDKCRVTPITCQSGQHALQLSAR